jgi:hypothetical protein
MVFDERKTLKGEVTEEDKKKESVQLEKAQKK